nr:uncharacterized protein LOC113813459 [Penaeus vannamei]
MIQNKPKPKVVKTFPAIAATDADEGKRPAPRDVPEPPAAVHLPGGQGGDAEGGLDGWEPLPVSQSMPDVVELVLQNRTKSGKLKTLNEKPKTSKNKNKETKSEIKSESTSAVVASSPDKSDSNDKPQPESTKRDSNEPYAETPVISENDNSIATIEESTFENNEVIPQPTKENGNSLVKTDTNNSLPSSRMSATPSVKSSASGQISVASTKRKRKINDVKHNNADIKSVKSVDTEIFGVPLHSADTKRSVKSLQSAGQKSDRSLQSAANEKSNLPKKSEDVKKSAMSLQSAGSVQSALTKRSLKSMESANARKYLVSMESEGTQESAQHLQSADTKKSVHVNLGSADTKKSVHINLGSADTKKSVKSLQSDVKKSDQNVQPTDTKQPDAPTRSADDETREKPLESAESPSQPAEAAENPTAEIQEEPQGDEKSVTSEAEGNKTDIDKLEEKKISKENNDDTGVNKTKEEKEISGAMDNTGIKVEEKGIPGEKDDNKSANKEEEKEISEEKADKKNANKEEEKEISEEKDTDGNADKAEKNEVPGVKEDNKDTEKGKIEDKSGEKDTEKDTDKPKEKEILHDDPSELTDGSQDMKDNAGDPTKNQEPPGEAKSEGEDKEDKEDSHKIPAEDPPQEENKTDSTKLSEKSESGEDKERDSGGLSGVSKSSSADTMSKKDSSPPPVPRISVPSSEAQVFTVDIPLSFEEGVPRLQSPKVVRVETENGSERRRSLVSITAEENYLLVHGQSPPRATSPSGHTSERIPNSHGDHSSYKNHSQEARLQNASNPTNRRADSTERDIENQSAWSTRAGVDQSITADGVVGGTTGVKDSGGKSTAGSSSRSVPGEGRGVQGDALRAPHGVKASDERAVRVEYDSVTKGSGYEVDHLTVPSYGESYARRSLPSVREDVLVEALAESARSYSGDLSRPLRRGEYAMPFPDNPRGTSLSSVEVPEGSINTVSLAVSKNGSHVTRPVRDHGGASLFDRFSTGGGSLWQKAPQGAPLVVKPSGVVYSREPREYEDYLPRESKRPPLQRRGSLGRIAVRDDYYDDYDEPPRQTWSKPRESRGSQTVRVKNEQPHHSILKKKAPEEKRDTRPPHRVEEHADVGPIIIASGLVPKNLESYTSEYQAALARNGNKGSHSNSGGHGHSGNGNGNGHHHTSGNGNGNGHYHTNGNNGYGTGGGNPYHSSRTTNSRSYPVKERDHFQERYFDHPPSVTAPLIAPQPKQSVGDVFDRLHRNVKPEHTQRKPEIKPKPKPPPPATQKTNAAPTKPPALSTAIVKDPVDRGNVTGSNSTTTTSASSKGSSGGGDVFTRLYENAPSRKRPEKPNESTRLLDVPEGVAVADAAPKTKKTAAKSAPRTAKEGGGKGDAVINMPLLAPDIVVDDMGGSSPSHGRMGGSDGYRGGGGGGDNTKLPIVMLQGFFRGPGDRSPHHRRPSMTVSELTLPPDLLDVTSVIRGALPVLPRPLAALCLTLNILLPGLGTVASGWMGLCWGRNRLSPVETSGHRFTSVVVTGVTGLVQLFTVTFFLVGWFWGVAWGILLVSIANKYANFLSEHRTSLTGAVTLEMLTVNAS